MPDALAALLDLAGVAEAAASARSEVDALLWDRAVRARMAEAVAESRLQGAWASAALEGAEVPPASVRDGSAADDSPMGRVVAAALRVQAELPRQVAVLERAPAQTWARLHAVAARGIVPDDELGRPRAGLAVDDPLRLGPAPAPAEVAERLDALAMLLVRPTAAPALVVAAIVHGELLALRPFRWGSGLVARAAVRLVLASRGVDPDGAGVPEAGVLRAGRPAYRTALTGYREGGAEGVAGWVGFCCRAVADGAVAAREALPATTPVAGPRTAP